MRAESVPPGLHRPTPPAPAGPPTGQDWVFEAIGTRWTVTTDVPLDDGARALVTAELARIDTRWSRFRPDSRVAEMSRRAGCYPIDPADRPLLDWYRRLGDPARRRDPRRRRLRRAVLARPA